MKPDLESLRSQFKEDVIKAAREHAKGRISQEDLEKLNPNINHFFYLTGYSAKELEEKVDVVIGALPDEFFKQTFRKTRAKTASLIAEEFLSTHYNLSNDNEFLEFIYELVDKIAGLFKESAVESLTGKPIEPLARVDKGGMSSEKLSRLLNETQDTEIVSAEAMKYLRYLIKEGNLLYLDGLRRSDPQKRLECINEFLTVYEFAAGRMKPVREFASENVDIAALRQAKLGLELTVMSGKEGGVVLPNGLTKRQEFALELLTQAASGTQLTAEQKVFLQGFISDAIGNMKLNGVLSKLLRTGELPAIRFSSKIIENIKDFTYNTKSPEVFLDAFIKLNKNYELYKSNQEPNLSDRVTLREYGILMSYAKTQDTFAMLYRAGIIEGDERLKKINHAPLS